MRLPFPSKAKSPFSSAPREAIRAQSDTNLDPVLSPSEMSPRPAPLTGADAETEAEVVSFVKASLKTAQRGRLRHEKDWYVALSFYLGEHRAYWDKERNKLVVPQSPTAEARYYAGHNLIKKYVSQIETRVLNDYPEPAFAPITDAPLNHLAAREGQSAWDHYVSLLDWPAMLGEAVRAGLVLGTVYAKAYWDPAAEADIPSLASDGSVAGVERLAVGDLRWEIRLPFDLYRDPEAAHWDDVGWVMEARHRPLDYFQAKWGDLGRRVEPDSGSSAETGQIEGRVADLTHDWSRAGGEKRKTALCCEYWQRPSARYPKGRRIVTGGDKLLTYEDLPDWYQGRLPYVPLVYKATPNGVEGQDYVTDLIPAQKTVNEVWAHMLEFLRMKGGFWLAPKGAGLTVEFGAPGAYNRVEYANPGMAPTYVQAPPLPPHLLEIFQAARQEMDDLAHSHDVMDGQHPAGADTATGLQILRETDDGPLSDFVRNIRTFQKRLAETSLDILAANVREPRMVGLDGPAQMQAFRALQGGGRARVVVQGDGGVPVSPALRQQRNLQYYQAGVYGPPGSPAAARTFLEESGENRADEIAERIAKEIPPPPDPAAAQMAQQQMEQAHEAQLLAFQHDQEQQSEQAAYQRAIATEQVKAQADIQIAREKAQLDLMVAQHAPPKVALSGMLDPTATVDAERMAGLGGSHDEQTKMKQPPPAASASNGKQKQQP